MNLGHYRLLAQLGAGADGISYRGSGLGDAHVGGSRTMPGWERGAAYGGPAEDRPVEIRVLSGARANESRWKALVKKLRLAAMLDDAAALGIQELALDHDPPYVVLEWLEAQSLAAALHKDVPLPLSTVVQLANDISAVLLSAHRLGLVHGQLHPGKIHLTEAGHLKIDFSGIAATAASPESPVREVDASCRPPEQAEGRILDPAADVYSLGAILF